MLILSLAVFALSVAYFVEIVRNVREGQEDDAGFHDSNRIGTACPDFRRHG